MINTEGRITIVEVKLARNPEIDRHIIGQIVDYASSLELLKFEEINERTNGSLDAVLKKFSENDVQYLEKKNYCMRPLEKGIFQLVIAVDSAPNELLRKWLYKSAHCDLDLRLATIQKYRLNDKEHLFVSNILVSQEAYRIRNPKASRPNFIQVIDSFKEKNLSGNINIKKSGPSNWAIYIKNWPEEVHYEFNDWEKTDQISVELMVKRKKFLQLPDFIFSFKEDLHKTIGGDIKWCPDRYGWARLAFLFNANLHPAEIAQKMILLISKSEAAIENKLKI